MPCYDNGYEESTYSMQRNEINKLRAIVCGVFSKIEEEGDLDIFLNKLDYLEMGVTKEVIMEWWSQHKREDEKRRAKERQQRERAEKRKAVLSKLTEEEKKLLRLRD